MMDVRPLHNEQDYDWAIRGVTCYFESEPCRELRMVNISSSLSRRALDTIHIISKEWNIPIETLTPSYILARPHV